MKKKLSKATLDLWIEQCLKGDNESVPFLVREVNSLGEEGFTYLLNNIPVYRIKFSAWKLRYSLPDLAEKYLTNTNVNLFIGLMGHMDFEEETAIMLAKKWEISFPHLQSIFSDTIDGKVREGEVVRYPYSGDQAMAYRFMELSQCDGINRSASSPEEYFILRSLRRIDVETYCTAANIESALSDESIKQMILERKLRIISAVLGLRYVSTESETEKDQIVSVLNQSVKIDSPTYVIESLKRGLLMAAHMMDINEYMESQRTGFCYVPVPKNALAQFSELHSLMIETPVGGFFSVPIGNYEGGHRRILHGQYTDPAIGKKVHTVIKISNQKRAEHEYENFQCLFQLGLPAPKAYGIVGEEKYTGIRVEDLSKNDTYTLVMDEGIGKLEDFIPNVANRNELMGKLSEYESTLSGRLDLRDAKNRRILGCVIDKKSHEGTLYFVDMDHVNVRH